MSIRKVIQNQVECNIKEIEKHLDCSFDKINNLIDQIFNIDYPIIKIKESKQELQLPNIKQFNLIDQQEFQSNIVQELIPLINSKIIINSQQLQLKQKKQSQIISQSQTNLKSFNYQLIQDYSIKQHQWCQAIAFNKDCSIVIAGCNNQINVYEFNKGMMKLIQNLNEHQEDVTTLNFMKKSNQFISGDKYGFIMIWSSNNNNNQWNCSQKINGHQNWIECLIMNNNEDLFISSSDDKSIKFWIKQQEWICQQTINDHTDMVYQLSLNEQQNQVISCGYDKQILIIEYSEYQKKWIVLQTIKVDCHGYRICFIDDNLFTFQPFNGNLMYVYEMDNGNKQFTKTKDIIVNQGNDGNSLFPQQYIKQKQLLVVKHNYYINLIRKTQNNQFKVEQSIQFGKKLIYGQMSDNGDYLITWDRSSKEIQIRKCIEQ